MAYRGGSFRSVVGTSSLCVHGVPRWLIQISGAHFITLCTWRTAVAHSDQWWTLHLSVYMAYRGGSFRSVVHTSSLCVHGVPRWLIQISGGHFISLFTWRTRWLIQISGGHFVSLFAWRTAVAHSDHWWTHSLSVYMAYAVAHSDQWWTLYLSVYIAYRGGSFRSVVDTLSLCPHGVPRWLIQISGGHFISLFTWRTRWLIQISGGHFVSLFAWRTAVVDTSSLCLHSVPRWLIQISGEHFISLCTWRTAVAHSDQWWTLRLSVYIAYRGGSFRSVVDT